MEKVGRAISTLVVLGLVMGGVEARAQNSWQVVSPGLNGTEYKFVATLDPVANGDAYVETSRPVHATHAKVSLWLDPTSISMPENGSAVRFMHLVDSSEGGTDLVSGVLSVGFLRLKASDHMWHASFYNHQDDGTWASAGAISLGTTFPVQLEIEFWAGSVGTTTFCCRLPASPGVESCTTSLEMANGDVDAIRVGLFNIGNPGGYTGSFEADGVQATW